MLSVRAIRSERVSRVRAKLSMLLITIMAVILRSWTLRYCWIRLLVPKVRMMEMVMPRIVRSKPFQKFLPFPFVGISGTSETVTKGLFISSILSLFLKIGDKSTKKVETTLELSPLF